MGADMTKPSERTKRMQALFGQASPEEQEAAVVQPVSPIRSSGAVRSMEGIFSTIEVENERLRQQLAEAISIVELDPDDLVPSFIQDRLNIDEDEQFEELVAGIREHGQLVPVLVRPAPDQPGKFQIAYGHRRWRACSRLKIKVKAVVRDLSDADLVIAQGKENNERKSLSFIEQALFAYNLREWGFDRRTVAAALGRIDDQAVSYISMLTQIASSIPRPLLAQIGPAQLAGRPKWERVASHFRKGKASGAVLQAVNDLVNSRNWQRASSDQRLNHLLSVLEAGKRASEGEKLEYRLLSGKKCISGSKKGDRVTIVINRRVAPDLDGYLLERLPALIAEYEAAMQADGGEEKDVTEGN